MLLAGAKNDLEYRLGFTDNLIVPEAQDMPAQVFKVSGPVIIQCGPVLPAVGFHDQLAFDTCEVGYVRTDRFLAAELEPADLPVAEVPPKALLGIG